MNLPLADQGERDRIATDLDATLFVEAAAGTGKTTAVVTRIVSAVSQGRLDMERLVAITFTVAAAGELRVRIREGLEAASIDPMLTDDERARCAVAAGQVERARIETIHAFCSALLRMSPLEAGLPPDFEPLDELAADIGSRERFRRWFDGLSTGDPMGETVRRGLLLGLSPASLLTVFNALNDNWDLLDSACTWHAAMPHDFVAMARAIGREVEGNIDQLPQCLDTSDRLAMHLQSLRPLAARVCCARGVDDALASLHALRVAIRPGCGRQSNWAPGVCGDIKASLRQVADDAEALLVAARSAIAGGVVLALRELALAYAGERQRAGVVTFQDILVRARNLMRDKPAVRDTLRRRWDLILVDEFQDTDPLQAELAFRLAAQVGVETERWQDLPLRPGVLGLIGDPKQSIYRFRRADIALYAAVRRALTSAAGTDPARLQVNFRSGDAIVQMVNHVFGGDGGFMSGTADDGVQAPHIDLVAHADEVAGSVHVFGGAVDVKAGEMWREEARATAAVITRVLAEGWVVDEGRATGARPCRPSDICVLMPARTNLRNLERALEDARLRYRLESGALLIATQEVRDLLNCLRAIDDPTDEVALVAALRSPAYGCSDADLLRWREAGGRWSYERAGGGADGPVAAAFDDMLALHRRRQELSPPALVEELISRRMLRAVAADSWRPREVLRRLRYVLDQVSAIGRTGRSTLHDAVAHLEYLSRSPRYDSVSIGGDDEDCVRVMTIHVAKGLEFPVVIITGFGRKARDDPLGLISDRATGQVEVRCSKDFATSGWTPLAGREKELQAAERRRLLYVALTRARDHLIVSRYRCVAGGDKTEAAELAERLALYPGVPELSTERMDLPAEPRAVPGDFEMDPDAQRAHEDAWVAQRAARLAEFGSLRVTSATAVAREADLPPPETATDVAAHRRGRGATSLGRAVHAVLQVIDLQTLDGLPAYALTQAAAEGIPERAADVERLVRGACAIDTVQRAAQARHWRELPLGAEVDGVIVEGFVDLLYEDADGRLVVLDYKTDAVSGAEVDRRVEHYRLQGGVYALLTRRVTGRDVARVEFVFAASGETRVIEDVDAAVAESEKVLAAT